MEVYARIIETSSGGLQQSKRRLLGVAALLPCRFGCVTGVALLGEGRCNLALGLALWPNMQMDWPLRKHRGGLFCPRRSHPTMLRRRCDRPPRAEQHTRANARSLALYRIHCRRAGVCLGRDGGARCFTPRLGWLGWLGAGEGGSVMQQAADSRLRVRGGSEGPRVDEYESAREPSAPAPLARSVLSGVS